MCRLNYEFVNNISRLIIWNSKISYQLFSWSIFHIICIWISILQCVTTFCKQCGCSMQILPIDPCSFMPIHFLIDFFHYTISQILFQLERLVMILITLYKNLIFKTLSRAFLSHLIRTAIIEN